MERDGDGLERLGDVGPRLRDELDRQEDDPTVAHRAQVPRLGGSPQRLERDAGVGRDEVDVGVPGCELLGRDRPLSRVGRDVGGLRATQEVAEDRALADRDEQAGVDEDIHRLLVGDPLLDLVDVRPYAARERSRLGRPAEHEAELEHGRTMSSTVDDGWMYTGAPVRRCTCATSTESPLSVASTRSGSSETAPSDVDLADLGHDVRALLAVDRRGSGRTDEGFAGSERVDELGCAGVERHDAGRWLAERERLAAGARTVTG